MSDAIFWRQLSCPTETREAILKADFETAREVLRAANYRDIISRFGASDDQIDLARDRLLGGAPLGLVRQGFLYIHKACEGDVQHNLTLAGLYFKRGLGLDEVLAPQPVVQECPVIQSGRAIADRVHVLARH